MDTMEAIQTRRSIRKYTKQPVPGGIIEDLLRAGMVAPSAMDERPWHFIVVTEKKHLAQLEKSMSGCEMLQTATAALLICGDEALEQIPGFWVQDCSVCAENILLAAHARGLGACWLAVIGMDERIAACRKVLAVPDNITPFALLSLGYPDESLPGEDRYDAARVHFERW